MKSQTNKLWPRVLSLVLSLSLVAGLMPAALASRQRASRRTSPFLKKSLRLREGCKAAPPFCAE